MYDFNNPALLNCTKNLSPVSKNVGNNENKFFRIDRGKHEMDFIVSELVKKNVRAFSKQICWAFHHVLKKINPVK